MFICCRGNVLPSLFLFHYSSFQPSCHIAPSLKQLIPSSLQEYHHFSFYEEMHLLTSVIAFMNGTSTLCWSLLNTLLHLDVCQISVLNSIIANSGYTLFYWVLVYNRELKIFKISQLDGIKEKSNSPEACFTQIFLYLPLVYINLPVVSIDPVLHIISFILCWSMNIQNNAIKPLTDSYLLI
jgi:hypothetical protein